MKVFNTLADLQAAPLKADSKQLVQTKGKLSIGDGLGETYYITTGTPDDESSFGLVNDNIAVIYTSGSLTNINHTRTITFDSVADLIGDNPKANSLQVGQRVARYYYEKGDAGYADGSVKTAAQAIADGDVIDGYFNVALANGNVWVGDETEEINPLQWGAKFDYYLATGYKNPSPTNNGQAFIAMSNQNKIIHLPHGGALVGANCFIGAQGIIGQGHAVISEEPTQPRFVGKGSELIFSLEAGQVAITDQGQGLQYKHFTMTSLTPQVGIGFSNYHAIPTAPAHGTIFSEYNVHIVMFEYALRHMRTLYNTYTIHDRGCKYAPEWAQYKGTPPFVWNGSGDNGWFNNANHYKELSSGKYIRAGVSYDVINSHRIISSNSHATLIDSSWYTNQGLVLGHPLYDSSTGITIAQVYQEFQTGGNMVSAENMAYLDIAQVFIQPTGDAVNFPQPIVIKDVVAAKVGGVKNNSTTYLTNLITADNSDVEVTKKSIGPVDASSALQVVNGGRIIDRSYRGEYFDYTTKPTIVGGANLDIGAIQLYPTQAWKVQVWLSNNGVNQAAEFLVEGNQMTELTNNIGNSTFTLLDSGQGYRFLNLANGNSGGLNYVAVKWHVRQLGAR